MTLPKNREFINDDTKIKVQINLIPESMFFPFYCPLSEYIYKSTQWINGEYKKCRRKVTDKNQTHTHTHTHTQYPYNYSYSEN